MIDYEAVAETRHGDWFDRLTALLIGLLALMAAALVLLQSVTSQEQARANAAVARLSAELTTRIIVHGTLSSAAGVNWQRGSLLSMEGHARQIGGLERSDEALQAIGAADVNAGARVRDVATEMFQAPGQGSRQDPYARDVLGGTMDDAQRIVDEQNRQDVIAGDAGARSTISVLGLSIAALSGVLVGLAAVVGAGRAGWALLGLAWLAGASGGLLLLLAAGVVSLPSPAA
jgi:hypothetical protein